MRVSQKTCERCGRKFDFNRGDARWCSGACAAAWARDHGEFRERTHAEKPNVHVKNCAHCGAEFEYNGYADRSGKRVPEYCSNKCRQAAYRARKGEAAGYTGHWDDARNNKKTQSERERQDEQDRAEQEVRNKKRQERERAKGTSQNSQAHKDTSPKDRWASKDPYIVLGVTYLTPKAEMKRAYMKLMKQYHPDVSKEADALRISKAVNAAWDKLK